MSDKQLQVVLRRCGVPQKLATPTSRPGDQLCDGCDHGGVYARQGVRRVPTGRLNTPAASYLLLLLLPFTVFWLCG